MHLLSIGKENEPCGVIEEDTNTVVAQLVAQTILVRVVHPFAHPVNGYAGRVLRLICTHTFISSERTSYSHKQVIVRITNLKQYQP